MQVRNFSRFANMAVVLACLPGVTALMAGSWRASAQTPTAVQGVHAPAEAGTFVRLAGHTPPQVLDGTATRVGHYKPENMLRLALALRSPHQAEEEALIRELLNPASPHFRQFLSPEECIARFSPSAEDEQRVVDWAKSQGLTVTNRYPNRLLVDLEAPAGTIERVFAVTINRYKVGADLEYSNDGDPVLPSSLTGIVATVMGLNNIQRMHGSMLNAREPVLPDYTPGPVVSPMGESHGPDNEANPAALGPVKPEVSNGGYIDPSDVFSSQMYDYKALAAVDHCCNPHNDSGGSPAVSSIALATWGPVNYDDTTAFFNKYGLNWKLSQIGIHSPPDCTGQPLTCYTDETTLDTEWSTATSNYPASSLQTAHVYIYVDGTWSQQGNADMYNTMLNDNKARVFSTSWSCTENYGCSSDDIGVWHGIFNKMVLQGWTLIAASGDRGASDDCSWNKDTQAYWSEPHTSVAYPASDPLVIGVGGTAIQGYTGSGGAFVWTGEPAWQGGTNWGSCGGNGGGSGGGVSAIFSQPSYQSGMDGTKRLVPDISLNSGGIGQNYYYAGKLRAVGGTSIAAPEIAGFFARENSYLNYIGSICGTNHTSACTPIGDAHGELYYQGLHNYAAHNPYYDITSGCNSNDATSHYGLSYFCAGKGYDKVTGWGAANMLQLAWALNWGRLNNYANGIPNVIFTGPATNKWYNTNQTVNWTINDFSGGTGTHKVGIAGFTQGWDSVPDDPSTEAHPGFGNSFYDGPQFPGGTKGWLALSGANGSGQGCHSVHVRGWNNEGWTTGGQTSFPEVYGPLCYDTVAPTIAIASNPQFPASGWLNVPVNITISATDPGGSNASGVAQIYTGWASGPTSGCKPGSTANCQTYGGSFTISSPGTQTLNAFSLDKAGNFSNETSLTIRIDTTAPATTAASSPKPGSSGWVNTAATVTLSATDNLSGVAKTIYWLDNPSCTFTPVRGKATCQTYTAPFSIATTGKHTVYFHSEDNAANVENVKTITVNVDVTAPATIGSPVPIANGNGWNNATVTVTLTATDSGSGVAQTLYWLDAANCVRTPVLGKVTCQTYTAPFPIAAAGKHTVYFDSQDKAGNAEAVKMLAVNIDETAPVTKATLSGTPVSNGIYQSAVLVALTASDDLSGAQTTYYSLDGGASTAFATPFSVAALGSHTLKFWSVDQAGNTEAAKTASFVVESPTATTLSASPNPVMNGQSATLTATVKATLSGTPTGTVSFFDNKNLLATVTLSGGVATMHAVFGVLGNHSLAAVYSGATNYFLLGNSNIVTEVVNGNTTTTLASSANPAIYGQPITFTATVKPSVTGVPTGKVVFMDGTTPIGPANLNASGLASLTIATLLGGTHPITASYTGDADYATSTSQSLIEIVNPAASTTTVVSSVNPSSFGQAVTLTATVTSTAGTPAGTVDFNSNGIGLGSATLTGGKATLTTTALPVGTDSIVAAYLGSSDFRTSTSAAIAQVVAKTATTTKVASSANPSNLNQAVTFTATVTPAFGGMVTGAVTFADGGATLGMAPLTSTGTAAYTTATLTAGAHLITAVYSGDTNYAASTSAALSQTVKPGVTTSRVVYIPDYEGQVLQVRVGTGTPTAITVNMPTKCNPNAVAVNSNKAYVVCNSDAGNLDLIVVYNASAIRSAPAGTLSIAPLQTIASSHFNSLMGIAFDASNNLWVANYGNNEVDEITAAALATASPTVTPALVNSPSSPVGLAFDKNGSLWVTGQYASGILLNFPAGQLGKGASAKPDYCLASTVQSGCQFVSNVFLSPEGLALFGGDVWVANNSTGEAGNVPGRELVDLKYTGGSSTAVGTLTVNATFGNSAVAADSPFVCPGGLFAGATHLWVNDESYGETNPQCGAAGDTATRTGGVFDFTAAQLAAKTTTINQVLAYSAITGRPGFGGIFVENDQ